MKDYYGILEIDRNADERQIKSAYFKLVRKYPPEKFPEEFMQLRAAYETLSDAKARKEYDRMGDLPYEAAYLFDQVQKASRESRYSDATEILKMIVRFHPALTNMKIELARAYEDEGKTGNAIKVWEELCQSFPEKAFLSHELALSYKYRGWRKKAIERFEYALTLDPGNAGLWADLIDCHDDAGESGHVWRLTQKALEAANERHTEIVRLYFYALKHHFAQGDIAAAEECLAKIVDILKSGVEHPVDEYRDVVVETLEHAMGSGREDFFPYVQQIIELMREEGELRYLLERTRMNVEIGSLSRDGFPAAIVDLLKIVAQGCDCEECANNILALEANILNDLQGYRPYIARLKRERSELFKLHTAFFSDTLVTRFPEKALYQRIKKLSRQGLTPEFRSADNNNNNSSNSNNAYVQGPDTEEEAEEDAPQTTTYRREGPKVGRNDPCPCGSGKKYKKCCGA